MLVKRFDTLWGEKQQERKRFGDGEVINTQSIQQKRRSINNYKKIRKNFLIKDGLTERWGVSHHVILGLLKLAVGIL